MAWFLSALFGTGIVASASAVAVFASTSSPSNNPAIEAVKTTDAINQSPPSPDTSNSRFSESLSARDQRLGEQEPETTTHSHISTRALSEVERYKERIDNPELCRSILISDMDKSEVKACRLSKDSFDVEFVYHTGVIGEMPILVKDLKFTYNQLVVNLVKPDNYGSSQKRLDLSQEIIAGRGLISPYDVSDKTFTNRECTLKLLDSSDTQKSEWKIGCRANSKL